MEPSFLLMTDLGTTSLITLTTSNTHLQTATPSHFNITFTHWTKVLTLFCHPQMKDPIWKFGNESWSMLLLQAAARCIVGSRLHFPWPFSTISWHFPNPHLSALIFANLGVLTASKEQETFSSSPGFMIPCLCASSAPFSFRIWRNWGMVSFPNHLLFSHFITNRHAMRYIASCASSSAPMDLSVVLTDSLHLWKTTPKPFVIPSNTSTVNSKRDLCQ